MNGKWWIVAMIVALIATLALVGCQGVTPQGAEAGESTETAAVRRDTLQVVVEGTGSLAPRAEIQLAFLSDGQVAEVLVEEG